jgi:uncharacterized low-complexity protein
MKKQNLVSLAIGTAFAAVALAPAAHAAGNPFGATQLEAGYQLAQADTKMKDGKCGEAKCGADKKAPRQSGADKKKTPLWCGQESKRSKCGADKKMDASAAPEIS